MMASHVICCVHHKLSRYDCLIQIVSDMNLVDFILRAKLNDNEFRAAIEVNQLIKYHPSLVTAKTVHIHIF